jgi:AcrR family transcriptional regulator
MVRTGRRPGESGTRDAILDAARAGFAEAGYEGATIRGIAEAAGVDPALVHHFFGTKEDLFVAAMDLPVNPAVLAELVLAEGLEGAGERLVRTFLSVWDSPPSQDVLLGLIRTAVTNDRAAAMLREFIRRALLEKVAAALGDPDGDPDGVLRAAAIGSHMVGMALLRYVIRLEPLASATPDEIVALLAPRIQSYLTG